MIPPRPGTPCRPDPTGSCDVVDFRLHRRTPGIGSRQATHGSTGSSNEPADPSAYSHLNGFERPKSFNACCVSESELPSLDSPTEEDPCPPPASRR